jgi:outer membrane protein OmpA-like peptidoglycan-associated protein/tetratricopeptide (TPR) repeat protein
MKTITIFFRNLTLVFAVCCVSVAYSQTSLQKAQALKNNYEYQKAIDEYTKYFSINTPSSADMRDLVECYNMVNDLVSAEVWLKKIISSYDYTATDLWNYASALKTEAKYKEAIDQFKMYALMENGSPVKAAKQIEGCELAAQWTDDPTFFDVANEKDLNSENSEFGLVKFGNSYIITSDRKTGKEGSGDIYGWTGKPYLKLYITSASGKALAFSSFSEIQELNNKYHNGPGIFDASNSMLLYTRTKLVKVAKRPVNPDPTSWIDKSVAQEYVNRLEIFTSKYTENQWTEPIAFEYNNVEEYSVGHPAITADGNTMYFVSDMPGGYGGTDIYYCNKLSEGKWSKPQNAGPVINTDGKEVFPFVDDDGTLYFSSDGHAGMGGLDIFKAVGQKNAWSEPENMKYPVNSPNDDFSIFLTETGSVGFLSSNRDGGVGDDDIYTFEYNPPTSLVLVVTTKERLENNTLVAVPGVDLKLTNKSQETSDSYKTDNNGQFFVDLGCATSYELKGEKEGYFNTRMKKFETSLCKTRHDSMFVEMVFDKIILNKPIVLENIYYDFDKWNIRPDAATELDKLVVILQENPEIKIELGSHTDCRGSSKYNQVLSQKRAESAVSYIISKGIDKNRITAKGYGETVLRNKCSDGVECSEAEHQLNRRTEFKVTGVLKKQ